VVRARALAATLVTSALVSCATHDDAPAARPAKKWYVDGGAIHDADGRVVLLRGVNLAGSQKMPPHIADFTAADYARIHDAFGFDVARFIVTWAAVEPQKGVYDQRYLDQLEERMRWARDAGLLVVVDMHQDLYGEGFSGGDGAPRWVCDDARYAAFKPTDPWFFGYLDKNMAACVDAFYEPGGEPRAHFIAAWRTIAARLAKYDNVIGFDILNEPPWGSYAISAFEEEKLAPFYVDVAKAVREVAPDWLVFAEPAGSRNLGYATKLPKLPLEDVVYAPHSYDSNAERGQGFDESHKDGILTTLKNLRAEADAMGAALFVGEYGGPTDKPGIVPYMRAEIEGASAVGASTAYWAFDKDTHGYAVLNDDGSEKKELADVLVQPYPTRVAGSLVGYAFDPGTRVATIRYAPDASVRAPTEIVAPQRVYANGVTVDCGGCAVTTSPGLVKLTSPPPGNPAVVTLRPR
jgi:endoglycosylceramidase